MMKRTVPSKKDPFVRASATSRKHRTSKKSRKFANSKIPVLATIPSPSSEGQNTLRSTLVDLNKTEMLSKYPIVKQLKMAHLGLRPKMIPKKTVLRFTEEIYESIGKLSKRQFKANFRDENGFSTYVHKFFKKKLDQGRGGIKKCEQTITNFLYSIDIYKENCLLCLLSGQLLAEMYGSELLIFVSELRMMIQTETRKSLLKVLQKKNDLESYNIQYNKVKDIIRVFLASGNMGQSVDSFMQLLLQKYPTINIDFVISYPELLHYTTEIFIHKRQIPRSSPLYPLGSARNPEILKDNVDFINDYDAFRTQNMVTLDESQANILEDCRFRIANLSHTFVDMIMEDAKMGTYSSSVKLKTLLTENLKKKSIDLLTALANEDKQGWFRLLLIDTPGREDNEEWLRMVSEWRLTSSRVMDEGYLESMDPWEDDPVTKLTKLVLQNKTLIQEVCKLVIYVTSHNV